MEVNLDNKLISIFGLHETGKTHMAKHIAENYSTAVFDVLGEYDETKYDIWEVQNDGYPEVQQEFDSFLEFLRNQKAQDNGDWDMLICDEASTVHPNKKSMPSTMNNFLNYYRHPVEEKGWDMGGIFLARRPARVNTNIVELSRYLFIFRVTGKNDVKYLNSISSGLGDMAKDLEGHEFILVNPNRTYKKMNPI